MSLAAATSPSDLPPRTWRGWWLAWPKWFRIGCWAGVGVLLLNIVLVVRIYVGLQEPAEITNFRQRGATISYFWESTPERFQGHHTLLAGLYGRSWSSVLEIKSNWMLADADLKLIAARARRLEILSIQGLNVSSDTIGELRSCRQLKSLDLKDTDADDAALAKLSELDQLRSLNLRGTLVSDAVIPWLQKMKCLTGVDLSYTDVSLGAIVDWQDNFLVDGRTGIQPVIATEQQVIRRRVIGSLRWSDGSRTATCIGPRCFFRIHGPSTPSPDNWLRSTSTDYLNRENLCLNFEDILNRRSEHEYQLTLKIGPYQAEPIKIVIEDWVPTTGSFEFRMPCTKAEALGQSE